MYSPVVRETRAVVTPYVAATLVKPAARIGVMPPPSMQYKPNERRAVSLFHADQLRGSLCESSGCGSKTMAPSFVNFLPRLGLRRYDAIVEGIEEAEVLAGAFLRPRGSFRLPVRRSTEPSRQR
jgi:hypothetical protein